MRKVIEAFINESVKDAYSVDKYDKDLTYDGKVFYFKNSKIDSIEKVEEVLKYVSFKGILKRWNLSKDDLKKLYECLWKVIPNKCNFTMFGERGIVTRGIKDGKNLIVKRYDGEDSSFDGAWYLKSNSDDTVILSENEAPEGIKYTDISNDIGKKHNFKKVISTIPGGKALEYEDDIVTVYQKGTVIYKGIEDDEPMKRANWSWNDKNKYYTYKDYVKVVVK